MAKTPIPTLYKPINIKQINIALTGKMRSGKDSVASAVVKSLSNPHKNVYVRAFSFGDSLKQTARQLYPHEFNGEQKPRQLIQWLGQTLRQRNENIWIDFVAKKINDNLRSIGFDYGSYTIVNIITDLRQPNEYEFAKQNDFTIIKVECDDVVRLKRMQELNDDFDEKDLQHETETYIDSFDYDYLITTTHINKNELYHRVKDLTELIQNKDKEVNK
ncbi:TPA: AAA family ATPase [Staphylococcus delphini]|nr:AAA family ATPase [Staphylococcus delphini]